MSNELIILIGERPYNKNIESWFDTKRKSFKALFWFKCELFVFYGFELSFLYVLGLKWAFCMFWV